MGTFGDSWKLTKTAFRLIKEDKALLVIPLIAGLAYLGIFAIFGAGFFIVLLYTPLTGNALLTVLAGLGIVAYFLLWFIGIYFNAALIGAATIKLNGGQATVADGLKVARANLGKLFVWALFAGTVGILIQVIASRFKGLPGLILGAVAEGAWAVMTYFMVPVLLYENLGVWSSLKTSASTYFHNFGKTFISNIVLAILVALPLIGAFFLGIFGVVLLLSGSVVIGVVLIAAALAIGVFALLVATAAEGILTAALYRYAKTGKIEEDLVHPSIVRSNSPPSQPAGGSHALPSSSNSW